MYSTAELAWVLQYHKLLICAVLHFRQSHNLTLTATHELLFLYNKNYTTLNWSGFDFYN